MSESKNDSQQNSESEKNKNSRVVLQQIMLE